MGKMKFKFKPGFQLVPMAIYGRKVLFCFGMDAAGVATTLKDEMENVSQEDLAYAEEAISEKGYAGRCLLLPSGNLVVHLVDAPNTATDLGTLAHEIFHVAETYLASIGMKLSDDSTEAYAYLIGFLTTAVFKQALR